MYSRRIEERLQHEPVSVVYSEMMLRPYKYEQGLYRLLGVERFRTFLLSTLGNVSLFNGKYHMKGNTLDDMKLFALQTIINERRHRHQAFMSAGLMATAAVTGPYGFTVAFGCMTAITGFPTILQRYNRERLLQVIERKERITTTLPTSG